MEEHLTNARIVQKENTYSINALTKAGLFLAIIINLATAGSIINIVLAVVQAIAVIAFVLRDRFEAAVLWHFLFSITCMSATIAMLGDEMTMYSYARLKLFGPIGLSYTISVALNLFAIKKTISTVAKSSILYRLYKLLVYFAVSGILIGIMGMAFFDYYVKYFINHVVYISITLLNLRLLLLIYSQMNVERVFKYSVFLLCISPIATWIVFSAMGIGTLYSTERALFQTQIDFYAPLLLILVLFLRNKILCIIAILFLALNYISAAGGGEILIAFLCVVILCVLVLSNQKYRTKGVIAIGFLLAIGFVVFHNFEMSKLFLIKLGQFTSLFSVFTGGGIGEVSTSPYIRIASVANILYEQLINPLKLLFGVGYGGTFQDSLNLMNMLDLTMGGWADEQVSDGRFPYGHGTIPCVALLNGSLGLFFLLRIVYQYIKRIKLNPLAFAAIPWLFLSFYFNTLQAMCGMFLLFGSDYIIKKQQ